MLFLRFFLLFALLVQACLGGNSASATIVSVSPPGDVEADTNFVITVRYHVHVEGEVTFNPLINPIDSPADQTMFQGQSYECPAAATNCTFLGIFYSGTGAPFNDTFDVHFTYNVECSVFGDYDLNLVAYMEFWNNGQAYAFSSPHTVPIRGCPGQEEDVYVCEILFYFDNVPAKKRQSLDGNFPAFDNSLVLMKASDSIFTYDGQQGTPQSVANSNAKPANLSFAYPKRSTKSEEETYLVSDNQLGSFAFSFESSLLKLSFSFVDTFGSRRSASAEFRVERESGEQYKAVSGKLEAEGFGSFDLAVPSRLTMFATDNVVYPSKKAAFLTQYGLGFVSGHGDEANIALEGSSFRLWIGTRKAVSAHVPAVFPRKRQDTLRLRSSQKKRHLRKERQGRQQTAQDYHQLMVLSGLFLDEEGDVGINITVAGPDLDTVLFIAEAKLADDATLLSQLTDRRVQLGSEDAFLPPSSKQSLLPVRVLVDPTANSTDAPPSLVSSGSGVQNATLHLLLAWAATEGRSVTHEYLLPNCNATTVTQYEAENKTLHYALAQFPWPGVRTACTSSFTRSQTNTAILESTVLVMEAEESFSNYLGVVQRRQLSYSFPVSLAVPRFVTITSPSADVISAATLSPGSAHLSVIRQVVSNTLPLVLQLQLLAPCSASVASSPIASVNRVDLLTPVVSQFTAQGAYAGTNGAVCSWSLSVSVSFVSSSACGNFDGLYTVDFGGDVNSLSVDIKTQSTCPTIVGVPGDITGSLMLFSDLQRTVPTTVIKQGHEAHWKTQISSPLIQIASTSIVSFRYTSDTLTWTDVTTTNTVINSATGTWWITHAAPPALGTYLFQVTMSVSTTGRKRDTAPSLIAWNFRASVVASSDGTTPTNAAGGALGAGAIVGIVIGVVAGAAVAALVIVLLVRSPKQGSIERTFEASAVQMDSLE